MSQPVMPSAYPDGPLGARLGDAEAPADFLTALATTGVTFVVDDESRADHGRDWWPLSLSWVAHGAVPSRPGVVVYPNSVADVSSVLRLASEHGVAVTPQGGRSSVVGGALPSPGGVALDLTRLNAVLEVDEVARTVTTQVGIFGPALEDELHRRHLTVGHFPQSFDISTVGGWLACRGAGQHSNRYGKIEDIVRGLRVVLASGDVIDTGHRGPRSAVGPDLTQLFVGSEGTLGVIVEATLVARHEAAYRRQAAYGFSSFASGLEACRRIIQRGAHLAVLRLYDQSESTRNFQHDACVLIVLDEGDAGLVDAAFAITHDECASASSLDASLVDHWLERRNDVSALAPLWERGYVVDTIEVAGPWSALAPLTTSVTNALASMPGMITATVHQSHAYDDGACLYFTFAGAPQGDVETFYREAWDRATSVVQHAHCAISHHHGVGHNRARFVRDALGSAYPVLAAMKSVLDPRGVLNPGVLSLGPPAW